MVSFAELEAANPQRYRDAAAARRAAATVMADPADDLAGARLNLAEAWRSPAAVAARDAPGRSVDRLDEANSAMMSMDQVLSDHADAVSHAKALVTQAKADAAGLGLTVDHDGVVRSANGEPYEDHETLGHLASQVQSAVDYANHNDQTTAAALGRLFPFIVEQMQPVDPTTIPPPGTDPRAVKAWWDGLSPAQQRWLIEHDPSAIGMMDGVPADARDQANRLL